MKLIRCHVENFGILSDIDYEFNSGLNIIFENNGFGKTTFAAFIKAMLFGFPKSGARNITENERKRYLPWQGGNYGGYLEFEYKGTNYRVKRFFGATASKDSFELFDLTNSKSSMRFKENLGEELFQLDATSFARSTFIPQLAVKDTEVTNSIRTKLSNLVDNTNDLNNYDSAVAALTNLRKEYKAYRGSGGRIGELSDKSLELESEIYNANKAVQPLLDSINKIDFLTGERDKKAKAITSLRKKYQLASSQKERRQLKEQYIGLKDAVDKYEARLDELNRKYPSGLPSSEEIGQQRANLSDICSADSRLKELNISSEDIRITEENQSVFSDSQAVEDDMNSCEALCSKLNDLTAKLSQPLSSDEELQLEKLSEQFRLGTPTDDELNSCLNNADELVTSEGQVKALDVSQKDFEQYERYEKQFSCGTPDQTALDNWNVKLAQSNILKGKLASCSLTADEQNEFELLKEKFASGAPTDQDIESRQNTAKRIIELESKENTRKTILQNNAAPAKKKSGSSYICGGIGICLLLAGIICFVLNRSVPGIILIVSGFIGVLAAFWLSTRRIIDSNNHDGTVVTVSAITDAEAEELNGLRKSMNSFLLAFYPDASDPVIKLSSLAGDLNNYNTLKKRDDDCKNKISVTENQLAEITDELTNVFKRYYPEDSFRDTFVNNLKDDLAEYRTLDGKIKEFNRLNESIADSRQKISEFLRRFGMKLSKDPRNDVRNIKESKKNFETLSKKKADIEGNNNLLSGQISSKSNEIFRTLERYNAADRSVAPSKCLKNLRERYRDYLLSSEKVSTYNDSRKREEARKTDAEGSLKRFLDRYQLEGDTYEELIKTADEDSADFRTTTKLLSESVNKRDVFTSQHPEAEKLLSENFEECDDPEVFANTEEHVQREINEIDEKLQVARRLRDSQRCITESIPGLKDRLSNTVNELSIAEKRCDLIDKTIEILGNAKDNLSHSYVGKIENRFEKYADLILKDQFDGIRIDKDLNPKIDDNGSLRDVECYSAGVSDCVMLCMRLSLVDALFETEEPFLILDDPFVNLDDMHTAGALKILNTIAAKQQVIYLTCNSSRSKP